MTNIWFYSDPHWGHENIIKYENRPFQNSEEALHIMVENWNKTIKRCDKVFVLGDVSFYNKEKTTNIINSLKGNKILIKGNHDKSRSVQFWMDCGFKEAYNYPIIYSEFYMLSHAPLYVNENMPYLNIHGHIHSQSLDSKQHFNVSVERIDYTPINFEKIKQLTNIK